MEDLGIFIKKHDYRNAIILAIELDQPMKLLSIFSKLKTKNGSIFGNQRVDEFMKNISKEHVFFD
jgi:U3 small nucleolar RNA-associated protein 13